MTVGFLADGKTITWSPKKYSKEFATFQLPCSKCIECRLEYARQWAIRCLHESKMYENNIFVTLTYNDENLKSSKLIYSDFQKFMKRLRKTQNDPIGVFVTGEYGGLNKRPHWHAILFNYRPRDAREKYKNSRGDQVFESTTLTNLWGQGFCEFGSVTLQSAGYCARYASKKLIHGKDGSHEYDPISKKSSKHAIGKKWLEKNYPDVFSSGYIVLPDGNTCSIPRYYEKWYKENHPEAYRKYLTEVKAKRIAEAAERQKREDEESAAINNTRRNNGKLTHIPTRHEQQNKITIQKHKLLQANLKL